MRRIIGAIVISAGLLVPVSAAPAQAGPCVPEQPCQICPVILVLKPKPHLESAQC